MVYTALVLISIWKTKIFFKIIFVNNLHYEIKFIFQKFYFTYLPKILTFFLQRFWKNSTLVTNFPHKLSAGSLLRYTKPWTPSYIIYSTLPFTVHSHLSSRHCNLRNITNLYKSFERCQSFGDMTPCRV